MKSEKYQQGMVMIIQLVVYWIMHIYRQLQINCSWFKETKSFRSIQQIVFQGVVGGESNTKIRLYNIPEKSKETVLEFAKGTVKVR